jgi:hypothetical protein
MWPGSPPEHLFQRLQEQSSRSLQESNCASMSSQRTRLWEPASRQGRAIRFHRLRGDRVQRAPDVWAPGWCLETEMRSLPGGELAALFGSGRWRRQGEVVGVAGTPPHKDR